jgi:hypothetical protein
MDFLVRVYDKITQKHARMLLFCGLFVFIFTAFLISSLGVYFIIYNSLIFSTEETKEFFMNYKSLNSTFKLALKQKSCLLLRLVVPESEHNFSLGNFMVSLKLLAGNQVKNCLFI